jgi:hypothetical protein
MAATLACKHVLAWPRSASAHHECKSHSLVADTRLISTLAPPCVLNSRPHSDVDAKAPQDTTWHRTARSVENVMCPIAGFRIPKRVALKRRAEEAEPPVG